MATAEELHDRLAPYHREAEQILEGRAETWQGPNALVEAMRYATLGGGKRIRPILTLATAEACGCERTAPNVAWPGACAVELVHTYSPRDAGENPRGGGSHPARPSHAITHPRGAVPTRQNPHTP